VSRTAGRCSSSSRCTRSLALLLQLPITHGLLLVLLLLQLQLLQTLAQGSCHQR
jgi:hypothetical protein